MRMTRVVVVLIPVSLLAACAAPVQPVPVDCLNAGNAKSGNRAADDDAERA